MIRSGQFALFFSACAASVSQVAAIFRSTSLFLFFRQFLCTSQHVADTPPQQLHFLAFTSPYVFSRTRRTKPQHWALVPALHTCPADLPTDYQTAGTVLLVGGKPVRWSDSRANVRFWYKADMAKPLASQRSAAYRARCEHTLSLQGAATSSRSALAESRLKPFCDKFSA